MAAAMRALVLVSCLLAATAAASQGKRAMVAASQGAAATGQQAQGRQLRQTYYWDGRNYQQPRDDNVEYPPQEQPKAYSDGDGYYPEPSYKPSYEPSYAPGYDSSYPAPARKHEPREGYGRKDRYGKSQYDSYGEDKYKYYPPEPKKDTYGYYPEKYYEDDYDGPGHIRREGEDRYWDSDATKPVSRYSSKTGDDYDGYGGGYGASTKSGPAYGRAAGRRHAAGSNATNGYASYAGSSYYPSSHKGKGPKCGVVGKACKSSSSCCYPLRCTPGIDDFRPGGKKPQYRCTLPEGQECTRNEQCSTQQCADGKCCWWWLKNVTSPCTDNAQCCSGYCNTQAATPTCLPMS